MKNLLLVLFIFIVSSNCRASNTFCQMACGMLISIGDFLRMGSDEIVKNMYDVSDDIDEDENATRFGVSFSFLLF